MQFSNSKSKNIKQPNKHEDQKHKLCAPPYWWLLRYFWMNIQDFFRINVSVCYGKWKLQIFRTNVHWVSFFVRILFKFIQKFIHKWWEVTFIEADSGSEFLRKKNTQKKLPSVELELRMYLGVFSKVCVCVLIYLKIN